MKRERQHTQSGLLKRSMVCEYAFRLVRYKVYEHESETRPRQNRIAATSNYPDPIFSSLGIIEGLRSPLSAAAVSLHTHLVSFLFICLALTFCTFFLPCAHSFCSCSSIIFIQRPWAASQQVSHPRQVALLHDPSRGIGRLAQTMRQYPPWLQTAAQSGPWCHRQMTSCWFSEKKR